ncbi:hypothetical protein JW992_08505 [candidate division KSB1 bacterium]|nr:hypothetical protein [candidate division KSB1 bacterium]
MYPFSGKHACWILVWLCLSASAFAQQALLSFSPGSKAVGLGKSGVIGVSDLSALYWNPAALGLIHSNQAHISIHNSYTLNYGGYAHFFPLYGTFAASFGRTWPNDSAIDLGSLGWGKQLLPSLYLGASLSSYRIDQESWTGGGFGLLYKPLRSPSGSSVLFADRLTLAAAVQNIPFVVSDYDQQIRLGTSFSLGESGLQVSYAHHIQREKDTSHLGFSFPLFKRILFSAGVVNADINHFGLGLELPLHNLHFSSAYDSDTRRLILSASFVLGPSADELAQKHYANARRALQDRDKRSALREARKTLAYAGTHDAAEQMVESLHNLVKTENQQIDSLLHLGRLLEKREWYISAAAQYLKVLRMDSNNKSAEQAITAIRPRVNIHTEKWYQLGVSHFGRGELRQAKEIFESILLVRNDHVGSRVYLEKIVEIFADEAEDHYYTGLGFYSQRNLIRAEEEFQAAVNLVPNYSDALEYLNRIREEKIRNRDRIQSLLAKAQENLRMQAWVSARNTFREILEIDPLHADARAGLVQVDEQIQHYVRRQIELGEAAFGRMDMEAAAQIFRRVLSVQPTNGNARDYLQRITDQTQGRSRDLIKQAELLFSENKWEQALAAVDSAQAQQPNLQDAKDLQDRILAAMSVEKLFTRAGQDYYGGNYIAAFERFNQVLEKDPHHLQALELREQCQLRLNELVDSHFNRGIQLYTQERYRSAIAEWDKALEINPYHKGSLEYHNRARERLKALNQLP